MTDNNKDPLQEPLVRCHTLLESSEDLYCITDADYRYQWANQAYLNNFNLSYEAIRHLTVPEVFGADYFTQAVKPRMDRCLAGEVQRYETEREYAGLGWRKLLVRYYPIEAPDQPFYYVGAVITDVTEVHEAEEALARQSELLDMAGRAARFGSWCVDLDLYQVEWSNVVAEIHGLPHGYAPTVEQALIFYVPEDRARLRALFTACVEKGQPYDEELQILDTNGQRVWVRTLGEPVRDKHGRIVQVHGAFQDVTRRRERESELRKLAHIINQSPAPVAITDLEGHIEYVNPAFEYISGYRRDELLGNTPAHIQSGETSAATYRVLWETINAGKVWKGELKNQRKDGTFYWESEVISPLKDARGRIINYVVIKQDITALKQAQSALSRMAFEDLLTGLSSRLGFIQQLQRHIDQHGWKAQGMVVILDITGLRDINDAYGYEAGDRLLTALGQRLFAQQGNTRLAGRIGGDEFVLFLLPEPRETPDIYLNQLLTSLSSPFDVDGVAIKITYRLGYTRLGRQPRSTEDLLREAEHALFEHRITPLAPWMAYTQQLKEKAQQRVTLTRELRQALDDNQFALYFQPKVDLSTGMLMAGEALLRWHHPQRGVISPGVFIPLAEQSQLIGPIGHWVLRRTCQYLRDWQEAGLDPVRISVNVSMVQFHVGNFVDQVRTALHDTGIAPEMLTLEVTESVFEQESDALLNQMHALRKMGVQLSLDDFGTGYSSLLYLQRYPFDEIKIDQGFVFRMRDEAFSRDIVETVTRLAKTLGANTVAEGIESAGVSDDLLAMGCCYGQGFFYSKPLQADDFRGLLIHRRRLPIDAQDTS